jgi:hypothetical protein
MNNIPEFPKFRKINLIKEEDVEYYTDKFPSYSDYNYISMYTYGLGVRRLSNLNDNLVVLSEDYVDDEKMFFGFIGINKVNETTDILLNETHNWNMTKELKLIPEISVEQLDISRFEIIEDEDNYDYILSSNKIYNLSGNKLRNKKNLLNRFIKNNTNIRIDYYFDKDQVISLFETWSINKHDPDDDIEKIAVLNALNTEELNYNYVGIYLDNKLISFFIYEIVKDYCILHFIKYDVNYIGICSFTYRLLAQESIKNNREYINIEQDLGIKGLKEAKKQLCPINYLKKYTIRKYE